MTVTWEEGMTSRLEAFLLGLLLAGLAMALSI